LDHLDDFAETALLNLIHHGRNETMSPISDYFGGILSEDYGLEDQRQNPELAKIWEKKIKFYDEMKADQERELKEFGYLKSYGPPSRQWKSRNRFSAM
jgi:1-acyl-sn-glycerol-3-phosphate acyltransferase